MKIATNTVVQITYQVKTSDDVLVDEAPKTHPLTYLHGQGNLISGLEQALEGKEAGEILSVSVSPSEGYGEYNDNLVQRVPKEMFEHEGEILEVGARFIAETDHGPHPVEITEIDGDEVVVDGNHLLAGETLSFAVEILSVREATAEEIAHGDVTREHDGCCGGHNHDHGGCGDHHHGEKKEGCCGGSGSGHNHDHSHEGGKKEGCCGGGGHNHSHSHEEGKKEGCCGGGHHHH